LEDQEKECSTEHIDKVKKNFEYNFIVLRNKYYVSNCESINLHFSDSGLFGFNFTGNSAYGKQIVNDMIEQFNGFRGAIDPQELQRAKNILKRNILNNLSNQVDRLEETARSVRRCYVICFSTIFSEMS
jgi:hypothetical protein